MKFTTEQLRAVASFSIYIEGAFELDYNRAVRSIRDGLKAEGFSLNLLAVECPGSFSWDEETNEFVIELWAPEHRYAPGNVSVPCEFFEMSHEDFVNHEIARRLPLLREAKKRDQETLEKRRQEVKDRKAKKELAEYKRLKKKFEDKA